MYIKHSLLIIFLFLCQFCVSYVAVGAERKLSNAELDSLIAVYEKTGSVRAANSVYGCLYMDYSDTLVVFTNRNDKDFVDANLYMVYSNDLYNRGLYAKAVRSGLLGASAAERIHDDLNLMSCYSVLCCCYQYLGSFDKAIIYADKLYKYDSESGDKDNLSSTLNNLAALYISAQKPRAAEKYILRAIELERQLNHPKTLAIRLGKAADVYIALKQYDKGLKYATEAYRIDSACGNYNNAAIRMCQMADNLKGLDRKAEARKLYEKAAYVFHVAENINSESIALMNLDRLEEALALTRITQNYIIQEKILRMLGETEKDPVKARAYMKEALVLNDTIVKRDNELMSERFNVEYETLQKDAEIAKKESYIVMQQQRQMYILVILSVFGVLAIVAVVGWVRDYKARRKLEESNHVKDRLISVISHDLSNSAANINMLANLVADLNATPQTTMLAKQSDSLKALLDNLLLWSRLQRSGMVQVNKVSLSLADVIEEAVGPHRDTAKQKNINVEIVGEGSGMVMSDRNCVKCMVRNLFTNAIKFTPENGTIRISYDDTKIEVSDSGVGMDAETLHDLRVGKKWTHRSGTKGEPGSGLGMSIVRDMIKLCGYRMEIESEDGKGSTFKIVLE